MARRQRRHKWLTGWLLGRTVIVFWLMQTPTLLIAASAGLADGTTQIPPLPLEHPIPSLAGNDPQGRAPVTLTLEDCIHQALKQATLILKSTYDARSAGEQLLQGYTQFLPNLVTNVSYNYEKGKDLLTQASPTVVQSANYGPSYTISTTLNLFNGLADVSQLHAVIHQKNAADLTLVRAKQQIALDIAQAFLQVILDQDIVEIAKKNLSSSQARQKLLDAQTTVGIRNLSDLFRQQAQTSSDELYLSNSENKARTDQLILIQKIRFDVTQDYQLVPHVLRTPDLSNANYAHENELIETALRNRSDLKAYDENAIFSSDRVNVARAPYFPRLDLQFSVLGGARHYNELLVNGVNSLPPTQPSISSQLGNQAYYIVGLNLTWEIFNRGLTRAEVARAQTAADDLAVDADDRRKQVVVDVRQALGDYRNQQQQLDSTQKGLVSAQKAFEVMKGRYEVGSASFIDLITTQAALVQAEASRAQAQIGFDLQSRAMETALGTAVVE